MASLILLDVLEAFLDQSISANDAYPEVSVTMIVSGQTLSGSLIHPLEYFADMQQLVGDGSHDIISERFRAISAKLSNHLETSHLDSIFLKDVRLVMGQQVEQIPTLEVLRDAVQSIALGELGIWH